VSTPVSDLMATSDVARGMETFLEEAVCIIQVRYIYYDREVKEVTVI